MGVFIKSGRYHYKRMIDGRRYYRSLGLKKGQESMLSARMKQVDDEITALAYGLPAPGRATSFAEYIKSYVQHKAYKKSLDRDKQRLDHIADILPDLPLRQYRTAHFEALERTLMDDGKKPATVNRYMELCRHFFNLAIRDTILVVNPLVNYEPYVEDGTRRALSDEEVGAVLGACKKIEQDKRFKSVRHIAYDLIILALATGMRLSEILNLRRDQLREDIIELPMSATKSRRRGVSKQRTKIVALSPLALEVIGGQPESPDGFVFAMRHRHPNAIYSAVQKIRELSGVKDFTFHALRHTASTIIATQSSLATARVQLGHSDIRTTMKYTHPGLDDQRTAVAKVGEHIAGIIGKVLTQK